MHNILEDIIKKKREDIEKEKPFNFTQDKHVRHDKTFLQAIENAFQMKGIAIIAEVKLASPTAGKLGTEKDVLSRVKAYEAAGADAISVVTEKHFFAGDVSFVTEIKKAVQIPVLQKDFVIDPYQIYEAKQVGADALLLIAKIVSPKELQHFVALCLVSGIEPVVEINDEQDLESALQTKTRIVAVNARNLETFAIDVTKACDLLTHIPKHYTRLGFSGVVSNKEITQYKNAGANGILVGTNLMKSANIQAFLGGLR